MVVNISSKNPADVRIVERASSTLPQTTQTPYFTVVGRVLVTQIIGEVTVVIGNLANNTKLISNPTTGADADICGATSIQADQLGTFYNITGTTSDFLVKTSSGVIGPTQASAIMIEDGTIDLDCAASTTGETKWTLHYIPLDAGSYVVAA